MVEPFAFPDDVPTLTDGEITLRAHAMSDVDDVVVQCTDPESVRWTTVPVPYSREDAVGFLTEIVPSGWETGKDLCFAIEAPHADGVRRFSGSIALRPMESGVAEIAFGLHPGVRGQGVCSRAVKLILDWGFSKDIELVVWYAHVGNWASWRVAWANGFSFDGKVAKFVVQRGERHDAWCGSLRRDDTREPKHEWHIPPTVETDRLRLRPHVDADGVRFLEMMVDERSRHFGGRYSWANQDLPPADQVLIRPREYDARGERYDWTIADRETDQLIGNIQLFNLGGLDKTAAEIGYSVHPDSRGKGVLTEALSLLADLAFTDKKDGGLGLRRLSLSTAASNKASRYGAERAGFTHVASHPDAFPTGETGFEDETVYARLNPNWTE